MAKKEQVISLTEQDVHRIVKESLNTVLSEAYDPDSTYAESSKRANTFRRVFDNIIGDTLDMAWLEAEGNAELVHRQIISATEEAFKKAYGI